MTNANQNEVKPVVGMGATILYWTDRQAATVIEVSPSGKTIKIQTDKAVRTDSNGMSECQAYDYSADPAGAVYTCRMTKKGWAFSGTRVSLGNRRTYHDFGF